MADITVLMTTFREKEDVLQRAIESVLEQTYRDFDFLIIADDPENHPLIHQLEKAQADDGRIRILVNERNLSLPHALNRGLNEISTKYVARMDADDIAFPKRLEKQRAFMETHSAVALCGSNITYMSADGEILHKRGWIPTKPIQIAQCLKYANIMHHPTFFFRTDIIRSLGYRPLIYAQDYDLTCRLAERGITMANLPESLLLYRQQEIRMEKKLRQWIISDCIRCLVKRKCLCDTDIVREAEFAIKNANPTQLAEAVSEYERSFELLRRGRPVNAVLSILKSAGRSPITSRAVASLAVFSVLKACYQAEEKLRHGN